MGRLRLPLLALCLFTVAACGPVDEPADIALIGGRIWTGDDAQPWAKAVAVRGARLLAVGTADEIAAHIGARTRRIDLGGRFVAPGFIDNHTHFDHAGALLLGVNLLDVADAEGLARRLAEAHDRMPPGSWIVGGDWGAYEAWARGSTGDETANSAAAPFRPHRRTIDPVTPGSPVLLDRWDDSDHLANGVALEIASITCDTPGADCQDGELTGRVAGQALERLRSVIPEKPMTLRLAEARVALARLASHGVTGIHDITRPEQLRVFQILRARGELTTRVYARPTLDRWEALAAVGVEHGLGDEWLRIGGLKGFVDGIMGNSSARFYKPYLHSGERGTWRSMMLPEGNMRRLLRGAVAAGHWPQVHAIGDEAIDTLLDEFEAVLSGTDRSPRMRVIHTQVLRGPEVAERMARLGVVAEVQPYHAIDDMRWMEERIGARSRWAYAFRTLHDAGVRLSFGSDWPGTNASWYPSSALLGIHAAVTRQTLDGQPAEGWFPEERIDVATALSAYTVNNAWAAGEEAIKGSLVAGKLADLVILDRDPFTVEPSELREIAVVATMVGGRFVFDRLAAD